MDIGNMTDNLLKSQAFKLKGRLVTLTVMYVLDMDLHEFSKQLTDVVAKAPRLFDNTPLVLDCSSIDAQNFDLAALCRLLREQSLIPVAIQGGNPLLTTLAQCQGLAVLKGA